MNGRFRLSNPSTPHSSGTGHEGPNRQAVCRFPSACRASLPGIPCQPKRCRPSLLSASRSGVTRRDTPASPSGPPGRRGCQGPMGSTDAERLRYSFRQDQGRSCRLRFPSAPLLSAWGQIDRSPRPVPVMERSVPLAMATGAPWARRTLALGLYHGFSGDRRGDFRASRSVCLDRQACRMRHAGALSGADARQDRRRCRTFPACRVGTSPTLTVARTVPV